MNTHLTEEELYRLLDSQPDTAAQRHLVHCSTCQAEATVLASSIAGLRGALTSYAAAKPARPVAAASQPRSYWRAGLAGTLAAAAIVIGLAVPALRTHPAAAPTPVATSVQQPGLSDEALLEGIDKDLSTSVPPSLEPLAVTADSSSATHNQ